MPVRIKADKVRVYADTDAAGPIVAELTAGQEVELGPVRKRKGVEWVEVLLTDGQKGYITGDFPVVEIKSQTLVQDEVAVHEAPDAAAPVKVRLRRGAKLLTLDTVKQGEKTWVQVRDPAGTEGFIDGDTK